MTFRHLKIFLAVCETGKMTRAAEKLYMAQPSVSQAIAELEKYYGVRLFERLNHRLHLTAAGERLQNYARHILNLSDQAQRELADLGQGGFLRIGASLTTGAHLLPHLLAAYREQLPQVEVFTTVDNTANIEKQLLEDQLDLGLVEGAVNSPHLTKQDICDDDLVLICPPGHALAQKPSVAIADLEGLAFIVREPGSGTRDVFEQALRGASVHWKVGGVYHDTEAIKWAVRAGVGLAVAPKIAIEEEVRAGALVPVEVEGLRLHRKFVLIHHRQKYISKAMEGFIRLCGAWEE